MSKRRRACDISPKVRNAVEERDNYTCIHCGRRGVGNSHYIKRSQGGLGVERNVVTHCYKCHYEYDHGKNSKIYKKRMKEHLKQV